MTKVPVLLLYRVFLALYRAAIGIAAIGGNVKARLWIAGRKNQGHLFSSMPKGEKRTWFHCASLGEFEQGRPVMESWRESHPDHKIVLTFFSPSGFEIRKNYEGADYILYLPADSPAHAKMFLQAVNPAAVFFVKYEFWYYYLAEMKRRKIPLYSISAIFRPNQAFFRWYGSFFRSMLHCFTHFFVQDETSASLLDSIGIKGATVSGDTRFDRVKAVAAGARDIPRLDFFVQQSDVLVAGSTWPEDETVLRKVLDAFPQLKMIIAPHEVNAARIAALQHRFPATALLSEEIPAGTRVVIADSMGLLSSLYRYGKSAWIGGGFGKGIHNILEAAVYGKPVLFGPRYEKFREAVALVRQRGAFSVNDESECMKVLRDLQETDFYAQASAACTSFVAKEAGATQRILATVAASDRTEK